jgi:hypothetical protein
MVLNNRDETKNLTAMFIFEIIGRPANHLTETMNTIIDQIDKEPRVSIKSKKIAEPKPMKDQKDFFTSFAEVEIEAEGILDLVVITFKYMPAHVEIINPEIIAVTNNSWSDILSELTRRLHAYDEVARVTQIEKKILENKLREILSKVGEGKLKEVTPEKSKPKKTKEKKKSEKKRE